MRKKSDFSCNAVYRGGATQTGRLLELLGHRNFKVLQREFGGKRVWIPKEGSLMPCAACSSRDGCIRAWRRQGMSVAAISRHLGISPKTTYRVIGSRSGANRRAAA